MVKSALGIMTAFLATACMQENFNPEKDGSTVTFTVAVPETVATKAAVVENGENINNLVYAVYRTEKETQAEAIANLNPELFVYGVNPVAEGTTTVFADNKTIISLELINNQKYVVLFWAQVDQTWVEGEINENSLTSISYPADLVANDSKYAAFSGVAFIEDVTIPRRSVTLTRPFAQINLATNNPERYDVDVTASSVTIDNAAATFNVATQQASGTRTVEYASATNPDGTFNGYDHYVAMNYIFANPKGENSETVSVTCVMDTEEHGDDIEKVITNVPVAQNYKTNIVGNLLTSDVEYTVELNDNWEDGYIVSPEGDVVKNTYVESASEILEIIETLNNLDENVQSAIITLNDDINLNDLITTRSEGSEASEDPSVTITSGNSLILDLNGKKLSATSSQTGKNYNMFDVRGNLTVKNGTIEYQHIGDNMEWNASTNIFNVTAGGVLNLDGVTAKNLGGSDMGFVAHLNNWGEVTLNAENCTLESNYVPVRVFNSGYDMNNVTIKNSTLKGGSAAFWVHNYTVEDFGTEEKAESQKALLNFSIYNQGNEFTPDVNGIRYGFTNSVRTDAYGITKTVSEDGTEVTLGTLVENGLVRRGVAGAEENTTITKAIVGEGITTLYDRTFRRFYALETVVLPNTLTTIGAAGSGVFQSCTALKNIVIPESVTILGEGAFVECTSLKSINIPSGITRIEKNTFNASGIESIEFHEGVTYFGAQAFRDCKQLKEVIINAPEFTVEANAFGVMAGDLPGTTIYVANAEMKAYLESTLSYKDQFKVVVSEFIALQAALSNGGDITLTKDITLLKPLVVESNKVNLDLNGKTIEAPSTSAFEVKAGGELTIKNGNVEAYESTVRAIGGKVTVESGEYTSTGTALDPPSTYRYSLDCREGGELIINGGTFKSNNGLINVGSTVTINGGKFENIVEKTMTRHLAYVSALLTINDGEFYGKANSYAGGCFFCGAAGTCDIQVKGGKFTSLWTSGSVNRIFESYAGGSKINVTGGMFNTNGGIATFVTENTDEATKAAYPYVAK